MGKTMEIKRVFGSPKDPDTMTLTQRTAKPHDKYLG